MKLSDILKSDKLSLSFEVFPPKSDTSFDSVKVATEEIVREKIRQIKDAGIENYGFSVTDDDNCSCYGGNDKASA